MHLFQSDAFVKEEGRSTATGAVELMRWDGFEFRRHKLITNLVAGEWYIYTLPKGTFWALELLGILPAGWEVHELAFYPCDRCACTPLNP